MHWPAHAPAAGAQTIKLPETLTWTAYDVGSGGYNQAVAIGNALKNKLQVNLRVLPGKNDVSRNIPLRDGKVPFSANGVGGSYLAQEGVYEFGARDWGPQAVRSLILNNSDALLTIVTAKDAKINTAADFKGKRVAWVVGAPSLNQNITALLAFAGLTWNDVKKVEFGGFGQAMDGIINNQVDAAFSSTISGNAYKIASSPRGIRYPTFPHDDKVGWARTQKIAPFFVPAFGTEGAELSKVFRLLKMVLDRSRPPAADRLVAETNESLPSGHATMSVVVIGTIVVLAWAGRGAWARAAMVAAAAAWIGAVGATRVYLGVHWVSDVLAGWAVGAAWLALCITLWLRWRARVPV